MSGDGPTKATPAAEMEPLEPLDDIILGEDDETAPTPPVAPVPAKTGTNSSVRPPAPASLDLREAADEAVANELEKEKEKEREKERAERDREKEREREKRRAKMTLRIPDDEVSRPQLPATTPIGGIAALGAQPRPEEDVPAAGKQTVRLRKFQSPEDTLEIPVRAAPGIDAGHERGWTPYQPEVVADSNGTSLSRGAETPPSQPVSDEIPVDTDLGDEDEPEERTNPNLPAPLDSEDIKLDEAERTSDPGEAPEIAPEDLVSVESIPTPLPPPVKGTGKQHAFKMPTTQTATSLMGALPPPAATPHPTTPQEPLPAPAATAPLPAASAPAVASTAAAAAPAVAAVAAAIAAPAAQPSATPRTPLVFVPPVGALAPPPMNESAASRKKTRPWWEELFNDDFIRTMAKVTDAQIAKEVTFIEESLGCEAGAMILDLACGTGRHAVEMAARGYQVCGFDLSLSMLARASDEAQERSAKINFVQGDMREMTFEETFDGIFCWNTSFGFFDEEKNAAVVARVHRALKKGGQFLLDVVNRDYIVRQAPSLAWFEGDGCICMDEMQIDFITSRMKVKRTLMMDDGRTKEIEYSIRVYALHELGKMLHDNGFRVAEVSGRTGTPGVFFGCESPRTLILAEKR